MEELDDKDFDQIFKNRIKEGYLEYEEESWLKMEKKLRKRDRLVFYRNASILLVFLSIGIGIYLMGDKALPTGDVKSVKNIKKQIEGKSEGETPKTDNLRSDEGNLAKFEHKNTFLTAETKERSALQLKSNSFDTKKQDTSIPETPIINQVIVSDPSTAIAQNQTVQQNEPVREEKNAEKPINPNPDKLMTKPGITFSLHVGPDFNSTENAIGGKGGMAVGVGVNIPISRKLSVQTGLNYGSKNYEAEGYDYAFNNPNIVNIIAGIDASCKVLEIPLRASYAIRKNSKNSIDVNAGLSSYFMLKENYRFVYTATSGRKDRFLEEKNANQHYLSVIDLSATYTIKLKNKKFAFGLEPYVKIPLNGIGEGRVPLKSSGVSLKLNYELSKKK